MADLSPALTAYYTKLAQAYHTPNITEAQEEEYLTQADYLWMKLSKADINQCNAMPYEEKERVIKSLWDCAQTSGACS